jgi:hypothetical protein
MILMRKGRNKNMDMEIIKVKKLEDMRKGRKLKDI